MSNVNLFIVGAQKAGTTSLHDYLSTHPRIFSADKKEVGYFSHQRNYEQGSTWYHNHIHFKKWIFGKKFYLDATPGYFYKPQVAERVLQYNSEARIVVMVRNPVDRAFSAYNMYQQMHQMTDLRKEKLLKDFVAGTTQKEFENFSNILNSPKFPTFEAMVDAELELIARGERCQFGLLGRGLYAEQWQRYANFFPEHQMILIESSQLKNARQEILSQMANFLGLHSQFGDVGAEKHVRDYQESMNQATRQLLSEFFAPHNQIFYKLVKQDFNW
jgi:hypothetical protein